jgi:hypothetical protein
MKAVYLVHGGCWSNVISFLRPSYGGQVFPSGARTIGFRLVRALRPAQQLAEVKP